MARRSTLVTGFPAKSDTAAAGDESAAAPGRGDGARAQAAFAEALVLARKQAAPEGASIERLSQAIQPKAA